MNIYNVSQWPNLRHLGESLRGAKGLLEAVSFKTATKVTGMRHGRYIMANISGYSPATRSPMFRLRGARTL